MLEAVQAQYDLQSVKSLEYFTDWSVICLQMPTSLVIFFLIYFGIKNHRANGVALWLLIASGVPMFLFSTSTLVVFVYTRKLILAQSNEDITLAFNQYRVALQVLWWLTLLGESCYNTIHWIFAMKYWTLAYKVKLLKQR